MKPATIWYGLEDRLYNAGFQSDIEVPYGKLELNVLLKDDNMLLKHFLHSYNNHGASFHQDRETIIGTIPKENIKIIADANEIIYQFLPCDTLKRFCDYLSEIHGLEHGLSENNVGIPDISVITKPAGTIFKGTLKGYNVNKIRLLLDSPSISMDLKKINISKINERKEILYSDSPLKIEDVFRAATSDK